MIPRGTLFTGAVLEYARSACHGLLPSWTNHKRSNITSGLTKLVRLLGNNPRSLNGHAAAHRSFHAAPRWPPRCSRPLLRRLSSRNGTMAGCGRACRRAVIVIRCRPID
jgi:hypothetical protein